MLLLHSTVFVEAITTATTNTAAVIVLKKEEEEEEKEQGRDRFSQIEEITTRKWLTYRSPQVKHFVTIKAEITSAATRRNKI
jgi:hypothetical protein